MASTIKRCKDCMYNTVNPQAYTPCSMCVDADHFRPKTDHMYLIPSNNKSKVTYNRLYSENNDSIEAMTYGFDAYKTVTNEMEKTDERFLIKLRQHCLSKLTAGVIVNVIYHDPATIVFWSDGTKTVVKTQDGEEYDEEKGLAMAIAKRALGNEGNYYNVFKKWLPKEDSYTINVELKGADIVKAMRNSMDRVLGIKKGK